MLVMDAVNRVPFNSRASEKEHMRYLRILDDVVGFTRDRLHKLPDLLIPNTIYWEMCKPCSVAQREMTVCAA